MVGEDAAIRFHTPSAERLFRREGSEIDGTSLLDVVHPEDRPTALALVADAIARPGTTPAAEWRVGDGDARWQFVEARANCVPGDPSWPARSSRCAASTSARSSRRASRTRRSTTRSPDLANRLLFTERVEHALRLARRGPRPVTVMFIDLDDFKNVNDTLGHAAGDHLLVELSHRLLACVRLGDTAARLGGDEFAVLVEEGAGLDEAWPIAERLLKAVQRPLAVAGRDVVLSAASASPPARAGARRPGDLLRNADVAMYGAKAEGKGRVVRVRLEHADGHPRAPRTSRRTCAGRWAAGSCGSSTSRSWRSPPGGSSGPRRWCGWNHPTSGPPAPRRLHRRRPRRPERFPHRPLGPRRGLPVRGRVARARRAGVPAPAVA